MIRPKGIFLQQIHNLYSYVGVIMPDLQKVYCSDLERA